MSAPHVSPQTSPPARHPGWLIALHWATLLLLLSVFSLILAREGLDGKALRNSLLAGHRSLGLGLLILTALRLFLRRARGPLPRVAPAEGLQLLAASAVHGLLYLALLSLPLLGWALSSAHGHDIRLLGGLSLPPLMDADADLADRLEEFHAWAGWTLAGLVGLHAAAALWHHFVVRDGVLGAMLPRARPRP